MLCNICLVCEKLAPNCYVIALKQCASIVHIYQTFYITSFSHLYGILQAFCTSFVLAKWSGLLCSDFLIPFSSPFLKSYIHDGSYSTKGKHEYFFF
jgi:hypothetical protein